MASPFVRVDSEGRIIGSTDEKFSAELNSHLAALRNGSISVPSSEIATHPNVGTAGGSLSGTEGYDLIAINLTAGQTYTFSYRGTPTDGVEDPYLALFGPGGAYVTEDDDGGFGRSSMITFTATESGTHYLYATSWYTLAYGNPSLDTGNYTINVWSPDPAHDAPDAIAGAFDLDLGANYGYVDAAGDRDMYALDVTEGQVYVIAYSGGVSGSEDFDGEPGENVATLEMYDANGNLLATNLNYESGLSYFAQESGTIYVRVNPYYGTGGYTIDVEEVDPTTRDPLESLVWDNANNVPFVDTDGDGVGDTAYVYFAEAGENFGETQSDTGDPLISLGWSEYEVQQVMLALEEYENILGVNYEITTDVNQATFRLITTEDEPYGARFYPQDPSYGTQAGIGTFNVDSGGWRDFPQSLERGGYSFAVILHEFGHAHGIAHPHDTGGGSEIMLGVNASTGSYGVYNLNQGVYTVMSYNDAWDFHPDGPSSFTIAGIDNGWSATLGAFDIAVLQERYGVLNPHNEGDTVYALTDVVDDAAYQTIWDTGGDDTISYAGARDAQIDLTAATLDYTPTGGGVISFLYNLPGLPGSQEIKGGFTIGNGVVIENASGGSGDDILIGNAADNVLTGNDGDDVLLGRDGADRLIGGAGDDEVLGGDGLDVVSMGAGDDVFVAELGTSKIELRGPNKGSMSVDIITDFDAVGDDRIDVSNLGDFIFRGTDANKNAGDLTFKSFDSIVGAENALGFDIDGNAGASGVSGPVTVVYGNVDGGSADFAIVLLNTSGVTIDDFILEPPAAAAARMSVLTSSIGGDYHFA